MTLKDQERLFLMSLTNTLNLKQVKSVLVEYEHMKDMRKERKEVFKTVLEEEKKG